MVPSARPVGSATTLLWFKGDVSNVQFNNLKLYNFTKAAAICQKPETELIIPIFRSCIKCICWLEYILTCQYAMPLGCGQEFDFLLKHFQVVRSVTYNCVLCLLCFFLLEYWICFSIFEIIYEPWQINAKKNP